MIENSTSQKTLDSVVCRMLNCPIVYLHHCTPVFHTLNLTFNTKKEGANYQNLSYSSTVNLVLPDFQVLKATSQIMLF